MHSKMKQIVYILIFAMIVACNQRRTEKIDSKNKISTGATGDRDTTGDSNSEVIFEKLYELPDVDRAFWSLW